MFDVSLRKLIAIAVLLVATFIPGQFASSLIEERSARQAEVENELTANWGPKQQLYAPVLVIPFQPAEGSRARRYFGIAATRLDVEAKLTPQERRRGLFHATVYDAHIDMKGRFVVPDAMRLREIAAEEGRFLWSEAFVTSTATSLTGLKADDQIAVDDVTASWTPCVEALALDWPCRGLPVVLAKFHTMSDAPISGSVAFRAALSLRGTQSFSIVSSGKELNATVRSPWATPSFGGDVLPLTSKVGDDGFEATWQTVEFGAPRIAISTAIAETVTAKGHTVSVGLIEATPVYRMISRTAKYVLLFIALTFAAYLFIELLAHIRIHIVQYGLLAMSMWLFPLLLLALGEPVGYTLGYVVSAALVLAQASLYTFAVAKRALPALLFAGMLGALFAFIYVLLGLESYALLIGALSLFVVVSALMALTQRVAWFRPTPASSATPPPSSATDAMA